MYLVITTFKQLRKISLNSAYGAIGNEWFRYYDLRIAEGITTSGQLSIRWIEKSLNLYLNKILKTTGVDYVIASDTDSVYITFDKLVDSVLKKRTDESEDSYRGRTVDFLDAVDPKIKLNRLLINLIFLLRT